MVLTVRPLYPYRLAGKAQMNQWWIALFSAGITGVVGTLTVIINARQKRQEIRLEETKVKSADMGYLVDKLSNQLDKSLAQIGSLEQKYENLGNKYESLNQKYEEMVEDRDSWKELYDQLWVKHGELTEKFIDIKTENEKVVTEKQELVLILQAANQRNSEVTTRYNDAIGRITILENRLNEFNSKDGDRI